MARSKSIPTPGCNCFFYKSGSYKRGSDKKRIQKYRCKFCGHNKSTATDDPCFGQSKRQFNEQILVELSSLKSVKRTARTLGLAYNTVLKKKRYLGIQCRAKLERLVRKMDKLSQNRIYFDEMESYEHTRCKPLSIALAVTKNRKIVGFEVSTFHPPTPRLYRISFRKYGRRPDTRSRGIARLMCTLSQTVPKEAKFFSDQNPRYPKAVSKYFPSAKYTRLKGRKPCVAGQGQDEMKEGGWDPLFPINQTAAMLRANVSCLIRKTWCSAKCKQGLLDHISIYAYYHNTVLTK